MKLPAPGRMVQVGPHRLHALEQGAGRPVVVLEAGIAATSISWCLIQKRVAEFTTVVSYDRGGLGWSDAAAGHGTARHAADDLVRLLGSFEEPFEGPFVLVGHSFGGLIVRLVQQLHPELVAGLVLVDAVLRSDWRDPTPARRRTLARGVALSRRGALLARIGVVRLALKMLLSGSRHLPKLLAKASAGSGAHITDKLVGEIRKMPREVWPAIAAHWSEPGAFRTMADNLENLPVSVAQLEEDRDLGDLPLVVLSASERNPEHARDAALSTRGEHIAVPNAGHWIQLDAPDAVVEAIRKVVEQVRAR